MGRCGRCGYTQTFTPQVNTEKKFENHSPRTFLNDRKPALLSYFFEIKDELIKSNNKTITVVYT